MQEFVKEIRKHLEKELIPFWEGLKDEEYGGFYGYMGYDLKIDKTYEKGCILNSRILWFFSNAYMLLKEIYSDEKMTVEKEEILLGVHDAAKHAWRFMKEFCVDKECGGVYWSVTYDGRPLDTTKHTYNQAFAVYALSSYYAMSGDGEALALAKSLKELIEQKCTDPLGYLEAFDREFAPAENDKLSENGVMAEKTMNTLLHVFEAYTEFYRVTQDEDTKDRLRFMLDTMKDKIYNPELGRQEVFFDREWNSLIDLYSYGHDIETAWLVDRGLEVLKDQAYTEKLGLITGQITENIYRRAFVEGSLMNEAENGVDDTTRVWWVQAEAIVGFVNGYQKDPKENEKYLEAAEELWSYIKAYVIDPREGSEWFWSVKADKTPVKKPIVEPWKCPYHNGRMCMEVIRRLGR